VDSPEYTSLNVASFAKIFMIVDFLCLLVQAVGGGLAGTAHSNKASNNGAYIMTAGVVLQRKFFPVLCYPPLFPFVSASSASPSSRSPYKVPCR
jgi:hypothetical protein